MKIKKIQLQKVIKEEIKKILFEESTRQEAGDLWAWIETATHDPTHQPDRRSVEELQSDMDHAIKTYNYWGARDPSSQEFKNAEFAVQKFQAESAAMSEPPPTEEEITHLQDLARLEDPIHGHIGSALRPEAASIATIYDPKYNPLTTPRYDYQQPETYVPGISVDMPKQLLNKQVQITQNQRLNFQKETQKKLGHAIKTYEYWKSQDINNPQFMYAKNAIKKFERELREEGEISADKIREELLADWAKKQGVRYKGDLIGADSLRFNVMGRKRYYSVPHMREYFNMLAQLGAGNWFVGDISKEGGGNVTAHKSHEAGIDVDIALATMNGGMSVRPGMTNDPGHSYGPDGKWCGRQCDFKGKTVFRHLNADEFDYSKNLALLRKTAPYAYTIVLNRKFKSGLKKEARQLMEKGLMGKKEADRLFRAMSWTESPRDHDDHIHVRLRGVYHPRERAGGPGRKRGWGRQPPEPTGPGTGPGATKRLPARAPVP